MNQLVKIFKNIWQKGFFHVLIANFLFAFVAFGVQLLVAKFLTEEELGYIKVFQSFTQILSIIAGVGFSTSVLVLAANPKNLTRKNEILQTALYVVFPTSIIVWLLFLFLNYFNVVTQIPDIKELFSNYSFVIVIIALTALFTAYFQAAREFKKYATLLVFTKIISLLIILVLAYFYKIQGFMNGLWLGLLLTLTVIYISVKKIFNVKFQKRLTNLKPKIVEQFKIGVHGLGANVFGNLSVHLDVVILSYFLVSEPRLLGQYSFATIFITGLGMVQGTVVQVATPYFSKYVDNVEITKSFYKKYSLFLFLGTFSLLALCYFLLPNLVRFFYENKFNEGLSFLSLLLFVWFFRCLNAINIAVLTSKGDTKLLNLLNFISVVASSIFMFFMLKYYSINEMIYAMTIIAAFSFILTSILIRNKKYV